MSWTKGKHSMRYGGIFTYIQLNSAYGAYAQAVEQLGTLAGSLDDMMNVDGNPDGSQLMTLRCASTRKANCPAYQLISI